MSSKYRCVSVHIARRAGAGPVREVMAERQFGLRVESSLDVVAAVLDTLQEWKHSDASERRDVRPGSGGIAGLSFYGFEERHSGLAFSVYVKEFLEMDRRLGYASTNIFEGMKPTSGHDVRRIVAAHFADLEAALAESKPAVTEAA